MCQHKQNKSNLSMMYRQCLSFLPVQSCVSDKCVSRVVLVVTSYPRMIQQQMYVLTLAHSHFNSAIYWVVAFRGRKTKTLRRWMADKTKLLRGRGLQHALSKSSLSISVAIAWSIPDSLSLCWSSSNCAGCSTGTIRKSVQNGRTLVTRHGCDVRQLIFSNY